jgi:predicted deacylase
VANPQAFHAGTRRNPVDLGDLNRAFPGNPTGGATERLADLLFQEFALGSDAILSLHGWSKEAAVVPYGEYPDEQSEPGRRSRAAAHALNFEFLHPYKWPAGVLGEAALKLGIPTVETEVGGMGMVTEEGQATYRDVVFRFMAHFGMRDYHGAKSRAAKIVNHTDIFANYAGLLRSRIRAGDRVTTGQLLATLHGLGGECLEEVRAPRAGVVAILRTLGSVHPGERLVQLFWEAVREADQYG